MSQTREFPQTEDQLEEGFQRWRRVVGWVEGDSAAAHGQSPHTTPPRPLPLHASPARAPDHSHAETRGNTPSHSGQMREKPTQKSLQEKPENARYIGSAPAHVLTARAASTEASTRRPSTTGTRKAQEHEKHAVSPRYRLDASDNAEGPQSRYSSGVGVNHGRDNPDKKV
jgi:hypothetical protein